MTEFFTVKQIDNSRLVRLVAPDHLRECARVVLLGGLIALGAFLYAWQHFETIQLRYQLESLAQRARPGHRTQSGTQIGNGGIARAGTHRHDCAAAAWA